jgi:hypothetical protein
MKLYIIINLFLNILSLRKREANNKHNNIVLKVSESYYNRLANADYQQFENTIFKEIEQSPTAHITDAPSDAALSRNNTTKREKDIRLFAGEYHSTHRVIKLYISHTQQCNVFVNDSVSYNTTSNLNFVEHMILHNNADTIEPRGVYSEDFGINLFAFNKKMNIFSVYFDDIKPSEFAIEYNYDAVNLIKTNMESANGTDYNSLIWKVLNQNFVHLGQNVTVELYFDLGKEFVNEDIEFNLNFTKSIEYDRMKTIVKYEWNGYVQPQEVVIIQAKFPLYFETCGYINVNWLMILIGSVFLALLVGMLYMIVTTIFFEELC